MEKKVPAKKDAKPKTEKASKSKAVAVDAKAPVSKSKKSEAGLKVPSGAFYGTGKRKSSIAKVWIFPGEGRIEVNGVDVADYVPTEVELRQVKRPLEKVGVSSRFDVRVSVVGGGLMGQAGAIQHGISRALLLADAEFRKPLKDEGFLTRDPRVKERKKYGRKRARKGFQFRKR